MLFSNLMYIQRYQEGKEREENVVDFFFPHCKHSQLLMKSIMFEQINAVNCRSLVFEKFILMMLTYSHMPDGFCLGNLALSMDSRDTFYFLLKLSVYYLDIM